jgi:DNA-directed RNA polymerase subunit RPC12/RpoP
VSDLLYECLSCLHHEVVKSTDKRLDGRSCEKCGGHLILIGPAVNILSIDEIKNILKIIHEI